MSSMLNLDDHTAKHCVLSIWLSPDGFSFLVLNEKEDRIMRFDHKESLAHQDSIAHAIKAIADHQLEHLPFRSINILLDYPEASCMPSALYDENENEKLFNYHYDLSPREFVINNHCKAYGLDVVFPIAQKAYDYFGKHFKNYRFVHRLSLLLHQANQHSGRAQEQLFIAYTKNHFTAVGIRNHGLIYHNAFNLNCDEDLIYYLLLVFQELKFDQYQAQVHLEGALPQDHPSIKVIKEYVQHLDFSGCDSQTKRYEQLEGQEQHYNTALLELSQCEL